MFTGIIQEIGKVREVRSMGTGIRLVITAPRSARALRIGESIAVSGVCQTVVDCDSSSFSVEAVEETLAKTTLSHFTTGTPVNLETPLRIGDPLGGHIVQGHVDGVGSIQSQAQSGFARVITVEIPKQLMSYVVPRGSIAINGASLTVADVCNDKSFTVSLIPETLERTNLGHLQNRDKVNIEVDVFAKYIEKLSQ